MKKLSYYFGCCLFLIFCSSCSKTYTYYTQSLYDQHEWSTDQLKTIQFYVSKDITLYKKDKSGQSSIQDGKIKVKRETEVDKIVIKSGTPGILVFSPKEDRYAVSFDNSGAYLIFGPGKKTKGRYTLRAKEWNGKNGGGIISYNGEEYFTDTESAYAALMVDLRKAKKSIVRSETASGRKVN